jgi:hypothetical protein
MQTKYNAVAAPAAMLLYGALHRRLGPALAAGAVAGAVFVGWEAILWLIYGRSHFLLHLFSGAGWSSPGRPRKLVYGLIANLGPIALAVLLAALPVLASPRTARFAMAAAILAFVAAAIGFDAGLGWLVLQRMPTAMPTLLTLSGLLGLGVIAAAVLVARDMIVDRSRAASTDVWFLVGWIGIEVAVYFAMSPHPGARRLGAIVVGLLLLCGQALARRLPAALRQMRLAAAAGAASGLVMLAIALLDSANVGRTAEATQALMQAAGDGGRQWRATSLEFEPRFEGSAVSRVVRGSTQLRAGDLVAIETPDPDDREQAADQIGIPPSRLEEVAVVRAGTNLGVRVMTAFYRDQLPWQSSADTRPWLTVYRVRAASAHAR